MPSKQFMARMGRITFLRYDVYFFLSALFVKIIGKIAVPDVSVWLLYMCDSEDTVHFGTHLSNQAKPHLPENGTACGKALLYHEVV